MKRHSPEEVIAKLRQAEADLAQGLNIAQVCQKLGASEPTLHRWRNQHGGLKADEANRRRGLEAANARPNAHAAQLALAKQLLQAMGAKKRAGPHTADKRA